MAKINKTITEINNILNNMLPTEVETTVLGANDQIKVLKTTGEIATYRYSNLRGAMAAILDEFIVGQLERAIEDVLVKHDLIKGK